MDVLSFITNVFVSPYAKPVLTLLIAGIIFILVTQSDQLSRYKGQAIIFLIAGGSLFNIDFIVDQLLLLLKSLGG